MKKIILLTLGYFVITLCAAQDNTGVLSNDSFDKNTENKITDTKERAIRMNDVYHKNQHNERHYVELARIREADIMWSRKIWREIDLRQKSIIQFIILSRSRRMKGLLIERIYLMLFYMLQLIQILKQKNDFFFIVL